MPEAGVTADIAGWQPSEWFQALQSGRTLEAICCATVTLREPAPEAIVHASQACEDPHDPPKGAS